MLANLQTKPTFQCLRRPRLQGKARGQSEHTLFCLQTLPLIPATQPLAATCNGQTLNRNRQASQRAHGDAWADHPALVAGLTQPCF